MQSTVWKSVFIQTLQLKLKTKSSLYLPGINSTNMRYLPAVYSIPSVFKTSMETSDRSVKFQMHASNITELDSRLQMPAGVDLSRLDANSFLI